MKPEAHRLSRRHPVGTNALDRAFQRQDWWGRALLVAVIVVLLAAFVLSTDVGQPLRKILITVFTTATISGLILVILWFVENLRYRKTLNAFRAPRALPEFGRQGISRKAIYLLAALFGASLGGVYFAAPSWRGSLWILFVLLTFAVGGLLWLRASRQE
jgi:membrane protease YdiL (CAAX protease family)